MRYGERVDAFDPHPAHGAVQWNLSMRNQMIWTYAAHSRNPLSEEYVPDGEAMEFCWYRPYNMWSTMRDDVAYGFFDFDFTEQTFPERLARRVMDRMTNTLYPVEFFLADLLIGVLEEATNIEWSPRTINGVTFVLATNANRLPWEPF